MKRRDFLVGSFVALAAGRGDDASYRYKTPNVEYREFDPNVEEAWISGQGDVGYFQDILGDESKRRFVLVVFSHDNKFMKNLAPAAEASGENILILKVTPNPYSYMWLLAGETLPELQIYKYSYENRRAVMHAKVLGILSISEYKDAIERAVRGYYSEQTFAAVGPPSCTTRRSEESGRRHGNERPRVAQCTAEI